MRRQIIPDFLGLTAQSKKNQLQIIKSVEIFNQIRKKTTKIPLFSEAPLPKRKNIQCLFEERMGKFYLIGLVQESSVN